MNRENEKKAQPEQEPFSVDEFRPDDAEGIVRLFRAVYGEGYPIRLFYDPEAIIAANREGRYISIVARTPSGAVIGATHLYRSAPYSGLYESGVGLVLKAYRNAGVYGAFLPYVFNEFVPRHPRIEEVFGELVCNHVFTQKFMEPYRAFETALEVALMPAEAYTREKSAAGRVATLDAFRVFVPKPHRIFIPQVYDAILRRIYARVDDRRELAASHANLPAGKSSQIELSTFDYAQVARLAVSSAGADFALRFAQLEEQARSRNTLVFQAWLNLTEPCVGRAVDILRSRGYFFGGALPRWFDGDGLLMQKLECPPDFENIVLLNDFPKELMAFIRKDREDCSGKLNHQ